MMRNSVASSMQKTYDECYLVCSTAAYYERQNKESEALRSWRSALDQISYFNAYRVPSTYRPKTETERTLQESLRAMEMQCRERVDLLEALRQSRRETSANGDSSSGSSSGGKDGNSREHKSSAEYREGSSAKEYAVPGSYPELGNKPPPLPHRPAMPPSRNSAPTTPRLPSSSNGTTSRAPAPGPPIPAMTVTKTQSRSPSPEKRTGLRTTLRDGKDGKRASKSPKPPEQRKESRPAAAKAATQAWGSISRTFGEKLSQQLGDIAGTPSGGSSRHDGNSLWSWDQSSSRNRRSLDLMEPKADSDIRSPSPREYSSARGKEREGGQRNNPSREQVEAYWVRARGTSNPQSQTANNNVVSEPPSSQHRPVNEDHLRPIRAPRSPAKLDSPQNLQRVLPYPDQESSRLASVPHVVRHEEYHARKSPSPPLKRSEPAQRRPQSPNKPLDGISRRPIATSSTPRHNDTEQRNGKDATVSKSRVADRTPRPTKEKLREPAILDEDPGCPIDHEQDSPISSPEDKAWKERVERLMKTLPRGVDEQAAKQIFNEIVIKGDEVHWDDVAGLDVAKNALKEAVVYPFLRPDLFMGLREPARGMLLFGPPGTGKTMLARAVATESKSTFFSISASSLTSKWLGESEKLVRALFGLAKALAPSIIFVDEIDSLLSSRSGSGEHEATRRIKTEFLIQWSDLARAAAGREQSEKEKEKGDASRVLVLAATNLPWAIDEAARRRFVRRQYIPLPEGHVREMQLRRLMGHQKHSLTDEDMQRLVDLTDGFSGSDITALAKDAAMGPLRSLGEALLHMPMDQIRPIQFQDFEASLVNIRPSVSKQGLKEYEDWAREFGERGG